MGKVILRKSFLPYSMIVFKLKARLLRLGVLVQIILKLYIMFFRLDVRYLCNTHTLKDGKWYKKVSVAISNGTKYWRVDQVKSVEDSL